MIFEHENTTEILLKKASNLFMRLATEYLRERGIAPSYTPFLWQLWHEDGQTQAALHRKIGIEQPTAVRTLDRMERDELITRVPSENDRRAVKIHLTAKAQQLLPMVIACRQMINEAGTIDFSNHEKEILHQYLIRIITSLEEIIENQFA